MSVKRKRTGLRRAIRIWADLAVMLALLIAVGTYLSIDQHYTGFFVVLGSALAGLGYLVGCAIAFLVWMVRFRWTRAGISAIKVGTLALLFGPCLRAGDYVHLALFYPVYKQQIAAHGDGSTGPVRFFWGDKALWVTDGLQADTLIYDPSDALATAVDEVRDAGDPLLGLATRHLAGHFYVEREFSR